MTRRPGRRAGVLAVLVLAALPTHVAAAGDILQGYHWTTKARWESATAFHSPVDQKQELLVEPTFEATLGAGFEVVAIGRVRADPADRLRPGNPKEHELWEPSRSVRIGDDVDLSLREFYVRRQVGPAHVTFGKQQVVWGTSDGFKVLDLVNPQDYREFVLDEFVDSRLPTWMANVEIPVGIFHTQLLWIPDRSYAELARPGSVYAFRSPQFVPQLPSAIPVTVENPKRPSRFFADSDVGSRVATTVGKWDLCFNYLWAYDDVPVLSRSLTIGPSGPSLTVTPEYRRTHSIGGSVNRTIGDWVVRSETAYSTNRLVYTLDPADSDGLVGGHETNFVAGLDWFGLANTLASIQFFGRYTDVSHSASSPQAGWTSIPTLLLRRTMHEDRVVAQLFWAHDAGRGDGMVRPSLRWELRENLTVMLGCDVFYGSSKGIFGEFDHANRVVIGLESSI